MSSTIKIDKNELLKEYGELEKLLTDYKKIHNSAMSNCINLLEHSQSEFVNRIRRSIEVELNKPINETIDSALKIVTSVKQTSANFEKLENEIKAELKKSDDWINTMVFKG